MTPKLAVLSALALLGCLPGSGSGGDTEDSPRTPTAPTTSGGAGAGTTIPYEGQRLSATRLLRRVMLRLRGRQPTLEEYAEVQAAPDEATRAALIDRAIDDALASPDFYAELLAFGHDFLNIGEYATGQEKWLADRAAHLTRCVAGSKHSGAYIAVGPGSRSLGDPESFCNDQDEAGNAADVPVVSVEPWWAPGSTVQVLGRAGSGVREDNGRDCGKTGGGIYDTWLAGEEGKPSLCSCGPNLVYCHPYDPFDSRGPRYHSNAVIEGAQARQLFDEPARLFAHVAWHDRPFSDLVIGNYSVMPLELRSMYVRQARHDSLNRQLDERSWWKPQTWVGPADPQHTRGDPLAWQEVVLEDLHPQYLALTPGNVAGGSLDRTYRFDPRVESGNARGIGAAGVLTTFVSSMSFARERVRAARYLETFACRQFVPPGATATFNAYHRDPATEGVCQHCHVTIDPAAVFFKRITSEFAAPSLAGVGSFSWDAIADYNINKKRWTLAFVADTVLTPATQAQLDAHPEARFVDQLSAGTTLFGQESDGTIGPLGFGKLLVASGEMDRCAVQKIYARFGGRELDPSTEEATIRALAAEFVAKGRVMRPLIRTILSDRDALTRGF